MTKKQRHSRICSLIEEYEISTQEELTELLNKEGYDVSQATVSRDINQLNLLKSEGAKRKIKYVKGASSEDLPKKIVELFKHVTTSIVIANNLIVIKTLNGNANSAGMAIDRMNFPKILGTIAGDDTLLIITKSESDANFIVNSLRML